MQTSHLTFSALNAFSQCVLIFALKKPAWAMAFFHFSQAKQPRGNLVYINFHQPSHPAKQTQKLQPSFMYTLEVIYAWFNA